MRGTTVTIGGNVGGSVTIGSAPNTSITVYLPRETKTAVKVRCAQAGESISDYALRLIRADMGLS